MIIRVLFLAAVRTLPRVRFSFGGVAKKSVRLAAFFLLALPAFSQSVFLNFDSVGDYTNNFNQWNDAGGGSGNNSGNYSFTENPTNGANGSGGVGVYRNNDTTATYQNGGWNFATNGATVIVSVMIHADGGGGTDKIQLGVLNCHTNGMNSNPGVAFETYRFVPASPTAWTLQEQYRTAGNSGTSSSLGTVNILVGHWYKFVVGLTNTSGAGGNLTAGCALYDYGTTGLTPGANAITFSTLETHSGQDIAKTTVWPGLRAFKDAGIDAWDSFLVYQSNSAPVFTLTLTNTTVTYGNPAIFSALADGPGVISYSWYTNGVLDTSAPGASLVIPAIDYPYTNVMVVAQNGFGSGTNSAAVKVTQPAPVLPLATTLPATDFTSDGATLNASVASLGGDFYTWFQYGPTTNYGGLSTSVLIQATNRAPREVSNVLTGLAPRTVYHFQVVCSNAAGLVYGRDRVFGIGTVELVTTLADNGPGSFRQILANAIDGDTITFSVTGTITNLGGILVVTNRVSILGPGPASLTIDGHGIDRVFYFASNSVVGLGGLTITGGHAANGADGSDQNASGNPGAAGGGICNFGTAGLTNVIITGNHAGGGGAGGFLLDGFGGPGGAGGVGGAIYNLGTLTLIDSVVSLNLAGAGGTGGAGVRGFDGGAGGAGGGIYNAGNLTVTNCSITGNGSGSGGAGQDPTSIQASAGNGGTGGSGGGIFNTGMLLVAASTFYGNGTGSGGSAGANSQDTSFGGNGGNGGGLGNTGSVLLINDTFAGNYTGNGDSGVAAGNGGDGRAIWNQAGVALIGCTLSANRTGAPGTFPLDPFDIGRFGLGGGIAGGAALDSTLVAGNPALTNADLAGAFTSLGHNLIGVVDGSVGITNGFNFDLAGAIVAPLNPLLGPLTNNGGPTLTMTLLPGSPAIDAGDDSLTGAPYFLATDQTGRPRSSGPHVDIGAYEAEGPPTVMSITHRPGGGFELQFRGAAGVGYTLQISTNLLNWTDATNLTAGVNGSFQFVDTGAAGVPRRFYRLSHP